MFKVFYLCWAVSVKTEYLLTIFEYANIAYTKKKIAIFHARNIIITASNYAENSKFGFHFLLNYSYIT